MAKKPELKNQPRFEPGWEESMKEDLIDIREQVDELITSLREAMNKGRVLRDRLADHCDEVTAQCLDPEPHSGLVIIEIEQNKLSTEDSPNCSTWKSVALGLSK